MVFVWVPCADVAIKKLGTMIRTILNVTCTAKYIPLPVFIV